MKKKMLNRIFALAFSAALSLSMTVPVMADALETPQAEAVAEGELEADEAPQDQEASIEGEIEVDQEPQQVEGEIEVDDTDTSDINADDNVVIEEDDMPYLALGANLSDSQKATVLELMGIDAAGLDEYHVTSITNEEEHKYLDEYLPKEQIGTRALSSVVIVKREKGNGLNISTKNINYCTIGMYKNALATAGLEDADIIVAGPTPISGTAALIGAMKAYAEMTGEPVDEQSLDAAMNEIVVTGELGSMLANAQDGEVEEFIAYVKQQVLEGGLKDENSIRECIQEALKKYDFEMNEDEIQQLVDMLLKISKLDIDVNKLLDQAGSIYNQFKNSEDAAGFFEQIIQSIIAFFENLFRFLK